MYTLEKCLTGLCAGALMIALVMCAREARGEELIPTVMVGDLVGYEHGPVLFVDRSLVARICFDQGSEPGLWRRCTSISVNPDDMLEICRVRPPLISCLPLAF